MDWNLISIIAFYSIIALFFLKNRKNIERQSIYFLYRTKKGLKIIDKLASKFRRFWKLFGKASIYAGFIGIPIILGFLIFTDINILLNPAAPAGVAPVIPGLNIPGSPIFLPFWYGIISLIIVLVVHEGSHGLVARANGLKLESAGVGLLAFLPLAFVEPDEKEMSKAPLKKRLSVYGAGPFSNIILGFLCLGLLSLVITPMMGGISVINVTEGAPADQAGIMPGDVITEVNNYSFKSTSQFVYYVDNISAGETLDLHTDRGIIKVNTVPYENNESKAYIGIFFEQHPKPVDYLARLLFWIYALNLGIGLVNLLPLGPIDGGRMISDTLNEKIKDKKKAKKIMKVINYFSLFLLLFAMLPFFSNLFATIL